MIELDNYIKARNELKHLANRQYTPDSCPLNGYAEYPYDDSHYELSQALFGLGQYEWTCEFCGKEFKEN